MYKAVTVILLVIVGIASGARSFNKPSKNLQHLKSNVRDSNVGIDLCPLCINEAVELINVALNVILDEGILQSCEELCNLVANKTHSAFVGTMCNLACDAVGIDEFIHLIIRVDLDPIWYCEIADLCPSTNKRIEK